MAQVHALLLPGIEQAELLQGRKAADAPLWRKRKGARSGLFFFAFGVAF